MKHVQLMWTVLGHVLAMHASVHEELWRQYKFGDRAADYDPKKGVSDLIAKDTITWYSSNKSHPKVTQPWGLLLRLKMPSPENSGTLNREYSVSCAGKGLGGGGTLFAHQQGETMGEHTVCLSEGTQSLCSFLKIRGVLLLKSAPINPALWQRFHWMELLCGTSPPLVNRKGRCRRHDTVVWSLVLLLSKMAAHGPDWFPTLCWEQGPSWWESGAVKAPKIAQINKEL